MNPSLFCRAFAITAIATIAAAPTARSDEAPPEQVPVFGLDENQMPVLKMIPYSSYAETLQSGVSSMQDSILPVLKAHAQNSTPAPQWKLQTIAVGLGLSAQIGFGPIWSVTAAPRFRLVFTNSKNPIYPAYN